MYITNQFGAFIVETIKNKCLNRAEGFVLPRNQGEIGVGVESGGAEYKVYNRFDPLNPQKKPTEQLNPGVGIGKQF